MINDKKENINLILIDIERIANYQQLRLKNRDINNIFILKNSMDIIINNCNVILKRIREV